MVLNKVFVLAINKKAFRLEGYVVCFVSVYIDCKTVRIFAYSSKREQSNERSGTRLKTPVRLLHHALPISLLILRKKPTVLQSTVYTISVVLHVALVYNYFYL